MRVFVTGASGFVGSAIVKELLQAGHQVLGLVRSDSAAEAVSKSGAEPYLGNIEDLESLQKGAAQCDAVIHTAFNHDFTRFKTSCEHDRKVIQALGMALVGTNKPLVITSGIGLLNYGRLVSENDRPDGSSANPRVATEEAALAVNEQGVNTYIVRLPPTVHAAGDHGFVPYLISIAKEKGQSVYIGDGNNHWPAVHRLDAAVLYRLIVEQQPAQKVYHAVAEEGIPFKQIATVIANGLQLPVASKEGTDAEAHFGWFKHFASMGCPASSEQTRAIVGWKPVHATLFDELVPGIYF
ncbi:MULTISPECIES: SDR family oxidoreductase [Niastella]|uniref:SDR family oxidoreductase n=1 Tax=Niastella soli TaxID=2821487 RepID=A0ABS3Z5H6_9BACT|nr:SDR family oxidoreductase [Niastella soli]MBO9205433.1 SDR family oxidoreductase [Niastella soli]